MNNRNSIILIVLVLAAIAVLYDLINKKAVRTPLITTFLECKAAGHPILESFPEQCKVPNGPTFVNQNQQVQGSDPINPQATSTTISGQKDLIRVDNVSINQLVGSPLVVKGSARGTWFFEASFPVELVDGNGKRLTIKPAQATENWMTENFVPFNVTLTFATPVTSTGTLILHKDNPSGEASRGDSLRIPVRFKAQVERTVRLYYYNPTLDKDVQGNTLCSSKGLVFVVRSIPVTMTPLQDTLHLFLKGELTSNEKNQNITSEFPLASVALTKANIDANGRLTVYLADPLRKTSGGSCRTSVLKAQIEATARQFPEVKTVVFSPVNLFQP